MPQYAALLVEDDATAHQYQGAHDSYLRDRESVEAVPEIHDISAGGMPNRVKCLHSLAAHSLAVGPGVNPVGDRALAELRNRQLWPHRAPCVASDPAQYPGKR